MISVLLCLESNNWTYVCALSQETGSVCLSVRLSACAPSQPSDPLCSHLESCRWIYVKIAASNSRAWIMESCNRDGQIAREDQFSTKHRLRASLSPRATTKRVPALPKPLLSPRLQHTSHSCRMRSLATPLTPHVSPFLLRVW